MPPQPPLNALRVFEAAARHRSFTRAAEELSVTQGAVSQQIRGLEDVLGVRLFRRGPRGLALTESGEQYAGAVAAALRTIAEATAAIRPDPGAASLTVSCLPSFAHKWLAPRIGRFTARHPGIALRVHTSFAVVDLDHDGIDCAIRHGPGGYRGLHAELLLTEELTPMCAQALAGSLAVPADLRGATLIQDFGTPWASWLQAAGLDPEEMRMGPEFLDSSMAMQAAADGQGVILGHTALAHDDLAAGVLVAPFPLRVPYDCAHWFVCRPGDRRRAALRAFHRWLRDEAAMFPAPALGAGRAAVPRFGPRR